MVVAGRQGAAKSPSDRNRLEQIVWYSTAFGRMDAVGSGRREEPQILITPPRPSPPPRRSGRNQASSVSQSCSYSTHEDATESFLLLLWHACAGPIVSLRTVAAAICGLLHTLKSNKVTKEKNLSHSISEQAMIEKLLLMLRDPDFRVIFSLARRIGVLFQTWDGHDELFQDILSNFSVKLVVLFKNKLVKANEVLAAGHQPRPRMETIIVTLVHLALHSEKIELEAVFMICVIAAIHSSLRELVAAVLDNLSKKLQYNSRSEVFIFLCSLPLILISLAYNAN
ncbi:hypothetical protein LXL04_007171 [Taraxacum kok-saghyz]